MNTEELGFWIAIVCFTIMVGSIVWGVVDVIRNPTKNDPEMDRLMKEVERLSKEIDEIYLKAREKK